LKPLLKLGISIQLPLSGVANGLRDDREHEADGSISWVVQVLVRLPQSPEIEPLNMVMLMPNEPL